MDLAAFHARDLALHVAGVKLPAHLKYADDITLLSQPSAAQHLLDATRAAVAPLGLHIAPVKSSYLASSPISLTINSTPVPPANPNNFRVLGF